MYKQISQLEHVMEGKLFQFSCAAESTLPQIKEALCKFIAYVSNIEDNAKAAQEAAKAQTQSPAPEVLPENKTAT